MRVVPGRVLAPLLAALAVLAVVTVLWLQGPGAGDDDGGAPPAAGGGVPPSAGVEPGAPGSGGPDQPAPAEPVPVSPGVPGAGDPGVVRIDGWTARGSTLRLHYTTGAPECYGTVDTPDVAETDLAVTVTLRLLPPKRRTIQACPDIALVDSVQVTLDAPLGSRLVRDGGRHGAPVPEGAPYGAPGPVE